MATSREERMASRLRGAGRHIVEDISFGFVLPEVEPSTAADPIPAEPSLPPPPTPPRAPTPRSANPNTSAKRRRIAASEASPPIPPPPPARTTPAAARSVAARPDPYDALSAAHSAASTTTTRSRPTTRSAPAADALRRSIAARVEEGDVESLPGATPASASRTGRSGIAMEEVVQESPVDAPGSGRRRRVARVSEVAGGAGAVLQRVIMQGKSAERRREEAGGAEVVEEEENEISADVDLGVGSSPLVRKVAQRDGGRKQDGDTTENSARKRYGAAKRGEKTAPHAEKAVLPKEDKSAPRRTVRRPGTGSAAGFGVDEVDELSPAQVPAASSAVAGKRSVRLSGGSADDSVDELSPAVARTARRSAKRPAMVMPDADAVDELSPAPAQTAKRSVGRPFKRAAERGEAPSPAQARSARRHGRPSADTGAHELVEPSPEPARSARRSVRVSDGSAVLGEVDELSPGRTGEVMGPPPAKAKPQTVLAKTKKTTKQPETVPKKSTPNVQRVQKQKPRSAEVRSVEKAEEPEEAEEIDATEAARHLGRKRPRRSIQAPAEAEETQLEGNEELEPSAKRRRGRPPQSPAVQQPSKTRKEKKAAAAQRSTKQPTKRKSKSAAPPGDEDELQEGDGTFPITVQRFTKKIRHGNDSDNEPDILGGDAIPFAGRAGVNAVDVLAQICEELVSSFLSNLHEQARNAADAAARREVKTMMRTLELFGEELKTRLLEHTIALDTLHALRKRVRQAQRDKIALREEILRIRREREEVELRKDAVRVRHERERAVAMANINLSSAMHDVDLAVEKGLAARPLSEKEESRANLANLDFLVSKVAEQACSRSGQGGTLKQIRDFNAFLERAAAALEGR